MGLLRWATIIGTGGLAPIKGTAPRHRTAKAAEKQVRLQEQILRGMSRPAPPVALRRPAASAPSKPLGWTAATILSLVLLIFGSLGAAGAAASGEAGVGALLGIAFVTLIVGLLRKAYVNEQPPQMPGSVGKDVESRSSNIRAEAERRADKYAARPAATSPTPELRDSRGRIISRD